MSTKAYLFRAERKWRAMAGIKINVNGRLKKVEFRGLWLYQQTTIEQKRMKNEHFNVFNYPRPRRRGGFLGYFSVFFGRWVWLVFKPFNLWYFRNLSMKLRLKFSSRFTLKVNVNVVSVSSPAKRINFGILLNRNKILCLLFCSSETTGLILKRLSLAGNWCKK